mmetsp:Transcript_12908/g.19341  ORF Transcript_12908/g.19341 Transcript_12908/m.19341 type:complete len:405 (-) Transcript_12908:111-1325(-)
MDARRSQALANRQALLNKRKQRKSGLGIGIARQSNLLSPRRTSGLGSPNRLSVNSAASGGVFGRSPAFASPRSPNAGPEFASGFSSEAPPSESKSALAASPSVAREGKSEKSASVSEVEKNMMSMGISATYDPTPKKTEKKKQKKGQLTSKEDRRKFLTSTIQENSKIMCNIKRISKKFSNPIYECYMFDEATNSQVFLMASRKRPKNKTSNYLISMDRKDVLEKESPNTLGKLRSNFTGTGFIVFDDGVNPKDATKKQGTVRHELASIKYEPNLLFNRGPRVMGVVVPAVKKGEHYRFPGDEKDVLRSTYSSNKNDGRIVYLRNKKPQWNAGMRAYCLNFHGRVTKASVKNFQLSTEEDDDTVVLQFGKCDNDSFTMDATFPLSPLQAFGICLSSFDNKRIVD